MTVSLEMRGWSEAATVPLESWTGVFCAMASTTSMPEVTLPKAAYWPSSWVFVFCMMKNCELAEL